MPEKSINERGRGIMIGGSEIFREGESNITLGGKTPEMGLFIYFLRFGETYLCFVKRFFENWSRIKSGLT
jgi:hypothetical protein